MLGFIRFLMKLKNREHFLREKYHRDHPHYLIYLAFDAILSTALVFGVVQFGTSMAGASPSQIMLTHSGGRALSAADLEAHVPLPFHHGARYWLGPIDGYTYTTNCINPGILTVQYLSPGQAVESHQKPFMTITAYEDKTFLHQGLHGLTIFQNATHTNLRGDLLLYDTNRMENVTIVRANSTEIIDIVYANAQKLDSMVKDSENLLSLN